MEFKLTEDLNLEIGALSWVLRIVKDNNVCSVNLLHGRNVELYEDFFVAGVWDGPFEEGGFINSNFACCTGGVFCRKGHSLLELSTPSHSLESLWLLKKDNCIFVSNSLAFLLSESSEDLDNNYYGYEFDCCSSILGFDKFECKLPLKSGAYIIGYRSSNILIDNQLNIGRKIKKSNFKFTDYQSYRSALKNTVELLCENAKSTNRGSQYGLITTISKGYDALAASVLAQEVGCDTAFTFNKPQKYIEDCGTSLAKQLGFHTIHEGDGDLYKSNKDLLEAETCASGEVGTFTIFSPYAEIFANKLLFMGTRGDSLWRKNHPNVNVELNFSYGNGLVQSDISYIETCLRNNIIVLHIPMIGADHWDELDKISSSDEMGMYSVGGSYDRPIPRRIVEEKGIDRFEFGQEKKGAGLTFHYDTLSRLKNRMSPNSYNSLLLYRQRIKRNKFMLLKATLLYLKAELPTYINYCLGRLHIRIAVRKGNSYVPSPLSNLLILWGVAELKSRYRKCHHNSKI